MLVAGVAHGDDAEANEFLEARAGAAEQFFWRLVEIRSALVEIQLAALEKEMRVRIDEAGQESVIGEIAIGRILIGVNGIAGRGILAGVINLVAVINDMRVAQRARARAIEQRADTQPDAAGDLLRGRRNDGEGCGFQKSTSSAPEQMAMTASTWRKPDISCVSPSRGRPSASASRSFATMG